MGISSGLFQQENKTKMNIAAASFRCHIVLALLSLSEVIKGELLEARSSYKPGHIEQENAEVMGYSLSLADCIWKVNDDHPHLQNVMKCNFKY